MKPRQIPATRVPRNIATRTIVIRLTPEEILKADQYSAEETRSRASWIRLTFIRGLEAHEYERERKIAKKQ